MASDSITVNKIGDYPVQLGMGCNIVSAKGSLSQCICQAYVTSHSRDEKRVEGAKMSSQFVQTMSDAATAIAGSLEIELDMAEVVKLSGKGSLSMDDKVSSNSVTRAFYLKEVSKMEILALGDLTDADIITDEPVTHVVTNIMYGKSFAGTMSLESNAKDHHLKLNGELQVKLASVPVGGTAKVDFANDSVFNSSTFNAEVVLAGGKAQDIDSPKSFAECARQWRSSIGCNVITYTLEPIGHLKKLKKLQSIDLVDKHMNDTVKEGLMNIDDLIRYLKHIVAKDSTADLRNSIIDMQDKCEDKRAEIIAAFATNQVKGEFLKSFRDYTRIRYGRICDQSKVVEAAILDQIARIREQARAAAAAPKPAEETGAAAEEAAPKPAEEEGAAAEEAAVTVLLSPVHS